MNRILAIVLLASIPQIALAWEHQKESQRDADLMHAYACGYQYAKDGTQCEDLAALAKRHGFYTVRSYHCPTIVCDKFENIDQYRH